MQSEQVEFDHNRNMLIKSKLLKKNNSHNDREYSNYYPNSTYSSYLLYDFLFTRSVLSTTGTLRH